MRRGGGTGWKKKKQDERDELSTERDVFADRKRLGDLIETATSSPLLHLDDRALTSIKTFVRASEVNVQAAFDFLLDRLKKNNSQARYLAVLLTDELFTRSKLFRSLLVPVFETFLLLTIGFRAGYELPPPHDRAELLKKKTIEVVEKWKDMFGQHYKPVRLGYDFLKTTLRLSTTPREAATLASQQRRERQERTQELLKKKFESFKVDYPDLKANVQATLDQIGACLTILEQPTQIDVDFADDEEEFEEYGVQSLRHLREEIVLQETVPHESRDNSAVFDTMRDLYRILTTRHLVDSQLWLARLIRLDLENERQSRDGLLRDVIDLRNRLLKTRNECEALGIKRIEGTSGEPVEEDPDEIVWEEGDVLIEDNSTGDEVPQPIVEASCKSRVTESVSTKSKLKMKEPVDVVKEELLKQAPMLPWGTFLDTWGSQSAVPANPRGLDYENHWGKVDYDVMIPAEKIAEIGVRSSYYKAPKVEIRPCLAPLRKGGLCQRRDLRICPFHGPIILRNSEGNPIHEVEIDKQQPAKGETSNSSTGDGNSDARSLDVAAVGDMREQEDNDDGEAGVELDALSADPVQLAQQAIRNIHKKDKDGRALERRKRSKRAREHNDACLHDAALARTRLGFLDAAGSDLNPGPTIYSKIKKPRGGLSALLRKTPTAKDRLARRLLNGRVRDATASQLARDEEAAYRESYPNQWCLK